MFHTHGKNNEVFSCLLSFFRLYFGWLSIRVLFVTIYMEIWKSCRIRTWANRTFSFCINVSVKSFLEMCTYKNFTFNHFNQVTVSKTNSRNRTFIFIMSLAVTFPKAWILTYPFYLQFTSLKHGHSKSN